MLSKNSGDYSCLLLYNISKEVLLEKEDIYMKMDLQLKTQQRMITQQMIQSSQILQMDVRELETYVEELALENPLVDLGESGGDFIPEKKTSKKMFDSSDEQNRVYYKQDLHPDDQWNFSNEKESLCDYVMSQLIFAINSPKEREILEYFVGSLNENGYAIAPIEETCHNLKIDEQTYEHYLRILQSVEPAGLGARDLKECLLLQLKDPRLSHGDDRVREAACRIVSEALEELGRNQQKQICQMLHLTKEEVSAAVTMIKKLNPKPGNGFFVRDHLKYIQPDVVIVKFEDYFQTLLSESSYPEITVNQYYESLLQDNVSQEVQSYIREKRGQIEWVKHCIAQRNQTLLKIVTLVVEHQRSFFEDEQGGLRPLRMADIANTLDIHESTVSRAVKNKYLQCFRGIYPMAYFFPKQFGSEERVPQEVKGMILKIIEQEDKKNPYSDQMIEKQLKEKGLSISRRTVAKYRQELGISHKEGRKEW